MERLIYQGFNDDFLCQQCDLRTLVVELEIEYIRHGNTWYTIEQFKRLARMKAFL